MRAGVRVGPDLRTHRQEAVRLALGKGRIGEKRGNHRLQRYRKPHFCDHVGFRGEIDVGLHRGRPEHHVEAVSAHLGHVARHDVVALFRHDRRLAARPQRAHAEIEKTEAEFFAQRASARRNAPAIRPWSDELESSGAPDSSNWPPGSSEMAPPPWLSKRPIRAPPSSIASQFCARAHAVEQSLDAALVRGAPLIGNRAQIGAIEGDFLVLRSYQERALRFAPPFKPADKFVARRDWGFIDNVAGHGRLSIGNIKAAGEAPKCRLPPSANSALNRAKLRKPQSLHQRSRFCGGTQLAS